MSALSLGLFAALAWAVHDLCLRYVSQRAGVLPALAVVLLTGALLVFPVAAWGGAWKGMSGATLAAAVFSGLAFAAACVGLYKAFQIGPVGLVAPVIGAYPVLSLALAGIEGDPVRAADWAAALVVIVGITVVAVLGRDSASGGSRVVALAWAVLGAVGFALTFASGQYAARITGELPVLAVARMAAILVIVPMALRTTDPMRGIIRHMPLLLLMGALDALALGAIMVAAPLDHPEFAAVGASSFGIITILLARVVLGERMTAGQWGGVALAFAGIGYLGL